MRTKLKLEFTPRFERKFKSLDRRVQVRILKELQVLTGEPDAGSMLRGTWKGVYSLRVGGLQSSLLDCRRERSYSPWDIEGMSITRPYEQAKS